MRVKVIKEFHDKDDFAVVYKVGEENDFTKERVASLLELGLVVKTEQLRGRKPKKSQE